MSQRGYYGYKSQRSNAQPYYRQSSESSYSGYSRSQQPSFKRSNDGYVQVHTDGSSKGNGYAGARAGYGVNFGYNHPMNTSRPVPRSSQPTNNVAELKAATEAIHRAKSSGIKRLEVRTDSQYVKEGATNWSKNWEKNGWRTYSGDSVKNQSEWRELLDAKKGMDVKFTKVSAHSGNSGNEGADRLAKRGADLYYK